MGEFLRTCFAFPAKPSGPEPVGRGVRPLLGPDAGRQWLLRVKTRLRGFRGEG
jgi:hypothetical protein